MVILVFPVKCKTMTETNIKVSKVCVLAAVWFVPLLMCIWFSELQIICAVHLAKPFRHYSLQSSHSMQLTACTLWLQGDPTGSGTGGQIPWHYPSFLDPPSLGRSPSSHRAEPLVAVCASASSLMALSWTAVLHCHSEILKGRLPQRLLSWSVAYILGSQEKYGVTKCILMWSYYGVACANYSINYYSFYETFFRRRWYHWYVL